MHAYIVPAGERNNHDLYSGLALAATAELSLPRTQSKQSCLSILLNPILESSPHNNNDLSQSDA